MVQLVNGDPETITKAVLDHREFSALQLNRFFGRGSRLARRRISISLQDLESTKRPLPRNPRAIDSANKDPDLTGVTSGMYDDSRRHRAADVRRIEVQWDLRQGGQLEPADALRCAVDLEGVV